MNPELTPESSKVKPATVRDVGAMTTAMRALSPKVATGPKNLRVGLIRGGKIISERILERRRALVVGSSETPDFAAPGLPAKFQLFDLVDGAFVLQFADGMEGRVAGPTGVKTLKELRAAGAREIHLNDDSRGRITIGDSTFLFQFVPPQAKAPRPQLPASVRNGVVGQIDWLFTAFVAMSFMIYSGFIVYLEGADYPMAHAITGDQLRDAIPFIIDEPEPPPPDSQVADAETDPEDTATDDEVVAQVPTPVSDTPSRPSDRPSLESDADARARIAHEARSQAQAMLMGAIGEGALADLMRTGHVGENAAETLANTQGAVPGSDQGPRMRNRDGGGGSGQGDGLDRLARTDGDAHRQRDTAPEIEEVAPRGNVNFNSGDDLGGPGYFDQAQVAALIRGRRSALRRCYETAMRDDPSLGGRVSVRFTIQPAGNVSGATATQNTTGNAQLGTCVTRVISGLRWREGPEGGSVSFQYPFMFAPQN